MPSIDPRGAWVFGWGVFGVFEMGYRPIPSAEKGGRFKYFSRIRTEALSWYVSASLDAFWRILVYLGMIYTRNYLNRGGWTRSSSQVEEIYLYIRVLTLDLNPIGAMRSR